MERRKVQFALENDIENVNNDEFNDKKKLSNTTIILSRIGLLIVLIFAILLFGGWDYINNKYLNHLTIDHGISPSNQINIPVTSSNLRLSGSSIKLNDKLILPELNDNSNNNNNKVIKEDKIIEKNIEVNPRIKPLREESENLINELRTMKRSGIVMETDGSALSLIHKTQDALRELLPLMYGNGPYYVEMKLIFPKTMNDYEIAGPDGRIIIEMAPIELVPYCVYYFLELVTHFKGGSFHRFAGHVLQAMANGDNTMGGGGGKGLAFQEYHPDNPHKLLTLGYAGRPGGPAFYISTIDNTRNHGPASQNSKTEADGCFGRIYSGEDVVNRMKKQPGTTKPSGFVNNKENFIKIESLKLISKEEL